MKIQFQEKQIQSILLLLLLTVSFLFLNNDKILINQSDTNSRNNVQTTTGLKTAPISNPKINLPHTNPLSAKSATNTNPTSEIPIIGQNQVASNSTLINKVNKWQTTTNTQASSIRQTSLSNLTVGPGTTGFISVWNTSITSTGSSNSNQITLPLQSTGTYNFNVSWGDNTTSNITSYNQPEVTHTYNQPGIYTVNITGTINGWSFDSYGDVLKLLEIDQWGTLQLGNSGYYFYGASNMAMNANDSLNLNGTIDFSWAFEGCTNFGSNGYIDNWNTSLITNMNYLFAYSDVNLNIKDWNVSSVTNMESLFEGSPFNQNISNWNTFSVTNMAYMFYSDSVFNQSISNWNTSNVRTMLDMFYADWAFNQPIGNWSTSNVKLMESMFQFASDFNQPIGSWDTSSLTDINFMFNGATSFNQSIDNWDTSHVTTMWSTFDTASSFNQPLNSWNVSSVTTMEGLFNADPYFNQSLYKWNTSQLTDINSIFSGDSAFNQPLNTWNTSLVWDMAGAFDGATYFNQPLNKWNTSNVSDMDVMFEYDTAFNYNISNWNTSLVTGMAYMFAFDQNFNQPLNSWNVSNVIYMQNMFIDDTAFNQPLDKWDVSNVTNMMFMFMDTPNFNQSLNSWNVGNVTDFLGMFLGATAFNQPLDKWNVASATDMSYMFDGATNFDQSLGNWNVSNVQNMGSMMTADHLSFTNYDQLLIGWSSLTYLQPSIFFDAGSSSYLGSVAGNRSYIINTYGWTITDGGIATTPSAPSSVAVLSGNKLIKITWKVPASDGGEPITSYDIYRSTSIGSEFSLVSSVPGTTFNYTDTGLVIGTTYYYNVTAINVLGEGPHSTEVWDNFATLPSAPRLVNVTAGNMVVYLSWAAPTYNSGVPITGFQIYRSTTSTGIFVFMGSVSSAILEFKDPIVTAGQKYYYYITSSNIVGYSNSSNILSATPFLVNTTTATTTTTTVSSHSQTSSTAKSRSSPGFEILFAVITLGTIALISRRRIKV